MSTRCISNDLALVAISSNCDTSLDTSSAVVVVSLSKALAAAPDFPIRFVYVSVSYSVRDGHRNSFLMIIVIDGVLISDCARKMFLGAFDFPSRAASHCR